MLYHRYANAVCPQRPAGPQADNSTLALVAQRIEHLTTDQKVGGSSPSERATSPQARASAELGSHVAQPVLQEALFGFAGRQGHRGVKFSGRLARAAEPTQVVGQGGVPQM